MTFWLFLYWTGCRISEALDVLRSQVDFESKAAVIETLKNDAKVYSARCRYRINF